MTIGERITELRKQHNISQLQLARLMDVSRQAVSKWENDLSAPDTLRLIQLAEVLDTDVEYLATGNHTPKPDPEIIKVVETVDRIVEKVIAHRLQELSCRCNGSLCNLADIFIATIWHKFYSDVVLNVCCQLLQRR